MDVYGIEIDQSIIIEKRLDDYLILSDTEKALESTSKGSAFSINFLVIASILLEFVFTKSLK